MNEGTLPSGISEKQRKLLNAIHQAFGERDDDMVKVSWLPNRVSETGLQWCSFGLCRQAGES